MSDMAGLTRVVSEETLTSESKDVVDAAFATDGFLCLADANDDL